MRFALMSDVHLEFNSWAPPELDVDLVVLAGDIHPGVLGVLWANEHFGDTPVLYVPGNHEFYGKRSVNRHPLKMKAKAEELGGRVKVLHNEAWEFMGVKFLGATLWTDYNLNGNPVQGMLNAELDMNDYRRCVYDMHTRLRATHLRMENLLSKQFLFDNMDRQTVVVTHHPMSPQALRNPYDAHAPAYASNFENELMHFQPLVCCSGHTHYNVDFMLGETRMVSNCRGYEAGPYEPLVVEV